MKGKLRVSLGKALIGGIIISAAVPQAAYWGWDYAYAATRSTVLRSVNEMATKLAGAMSNRRETITFTYEGKTANLKSKVQVAIDQAMSSDPYLYYIIDSYGYSYRGSSRSMNITVQVEYLETLQETAYVNREVKRILAGLITPEMNSHQKVKAIHDWVVLHLKYDSSYRRYTAYEGLKSGSAVCQGYSLLSYKLLQAAGIPNKIVEGTARQEGGSSQSHAWNLVQLNGSWYHLDTTWDDPTPDQDGVVSNMYYLRTDGQMRRDHAWTKSYPAASQAYYKTLAKLSELGGSSAIVYQKLQKELHYVLYEEQLVVRSFADLQPRMSQALESGEHSLLFRYRGTERELKSDLQKLYAQGFGFKQLSYSSAAFEDTGDLRVYVAWP